MPNQHEARIQNMPPEVATLLSTSKEHIGKALRHLVVIPDSETLRKPDPIEVADAMETTLKTVDRVGIPTVTILFPQLPGQIPRFSQLEDALDSIEDTVSHLGFRFHPVGKINGTPESFQRVVRNLAKKTEGNDGKIFYFPVPGNLNAYQGRKSITEAIRDIIVDEKILKKGGFLKLDPKAQEDAVSKRLVQPEPDFVIFTGVHPIDYLEVETSNSEGKQVTQLKPEYLLHLPGALSWELSYSEFGATPHRFTDLTQERLLVTIAQFMKRSRRMGGLEEQNSLKNGS